MSLGVITHCHRHHRYRLNREHWAEWKRWPLCNKNCIFKRHIRKNKISMIAQTRPLFSSSSDMLQIAMTRKYGECRICYMHHLKRILKCALLNCSVEDVKLETLIHEKRHLEFSSCNHGESKAPIRDDSSELIETMLYRTILI